MDEMVSALISGFTLIKDKIVSAMAGIAPVALIVLGIIVLWTFAIAFFRMIGK
jgi:hypothetical protein